MKIKLLALLSVFVITAGCTTPVNTGYPSGTYTYNAGGLMMEPNPTLIFEGNTMEISTVTGNALKFKYTLSGTYTTFSGGFIALKNSVTGATSKEPFEYVANKNLVVFRNLSYYK